MPTTRSMEDSLGMATAGAARLFFSGHSCSNPGYAHTVRGVPIEKRPRLVSAARVPAS